MGSAKALVRAGWNRASRIYRPDRAKAGVFGLADASAKGWLRPFFERLPPDARVVDLGCGCGVPTTRYLARRFQVTGVDISDVQVDRARRLVPSATFLREDMCSIRFRAGSLAGVVALYSFIHVPLREQRPLLRRIHRWLVPEGLLLLIAGHTPYTGTEPDWLGSGAPMYWSHAGAATYAAWLEELGFEIERREFVPEGASGHTLFLARRAPTRTADHIGAAPPPERVARRRRAGPRHSRLLNR